MKRDANGRFAKGNSGGPGRGKKARDERYYEILQTACTFEKWKRIIDKAVEQAADGDKDARKFLAGYLMGEPDRYLEVDTKVDMFDFDAWAKERSQRLDEVNQLEDGET